MSSHDQPLLTNHPITPHNPEELTPEQEALLAQQWLASQAMCNVGDEAGYKGFFDTPIIHDGSADCGDQDEHHGCIIVNGFARPDPNWVP